MSGLFYITLRHSGVVQQKLFSPRRSKHRIGAGCVLRKAPSGWARRVKKICLWHIFSQSGKQAMLATWAEGWLAQARLREHARLSKNGCRMARRKLYVHTGSFHHFVVPLPLGGRLLVTTRHQVTSIFCRAAMPIQNALYMSLVLLGFDPKMIYLGLTDNFYLSTFANKYLQICDF